MTVVTVGGAQPKFIAGVYSNPFLVRNSGEATVYLGQDSSLSVIARAITLGPGASLNWQGKTELWAITDAGETGELEWLYDADTTITPGPDVVTTRLVYETLYQNLTTPIQPSVVNTLIDSVDVDAYQSLMVSITAPAAITCSTPTFTLRVRQYSAAGLIVHTAEPRFSGLGNFTVPLIGSLVTVSVYGDSSFISTNREITISATNALLGRSYYHNPGSIGQVTGASGAVIVEDYSLSKYSAAQYVAPIANPAFYFASSWSGPGTYTVRSTASSSQPSTTRLLAAGLDEPLDTTDFALSQQDGFTKSVTFPEMPLVVEASATTNPRRFRVALTFPPSP